MTCELLPGLVKPIDALIKYFLEIKPYHTKLLEVIERYRFNEYISVGFEENHSIDLIKRNMALCGPVGFGLVWDEECGFDAVECCDLFQCIGGYGLIYDNSDLLVDLPIYSIDESSDSFVLEGDQTFDKKIQIWSITENNKIKLNGDYTSYFDIHKLFLIVPFNVFDIVDITEHSFFLSGNRESEFESRKDFRVTNSRYNNGTFAVKTVNYVPNTNKTEVTVNDTLDLTAVAGYIEVKSPNKNNGAYQIQSASFDGVFTTLTINSSNALNYNNETSNGCIQLRTGYFAARRVWHYNPDDTLLTEYKIINSSYNIEEDKTYVVTAEKIHTPLTGTGDLRIYGYKFGAGFDGFEECSTPKPFNVHANVGEVLTITVNRTPVTPTPTPTISVTPTMTPTITPTA